MPYYGGQLPPGENPADYGYFDEFAAQAHYYANAVPQTNPYYPPLPQAQPPPVQYYQQPQPIQLPVQYHPQPQPQYHHHHQQQQQKPYPQPVQDRTPHVQVVIPSYSAQSHAQQLPAMSPPATTNNRIFQDVPTPNMPKQHTDVKVEIRIPPPVTDELDYAGLLLTLAEEYLDTAHTVSHGSPEYCKLVATALGCLESVLNNFKLQPLKEAHLCLLYAQVLFDETENNDEIENILAKSIELCERNRFIDLKYTMQALLAQALYRSKPKAATKDLQSMIEDAEAYRHTAWEYNLRFLSASLSLSSTSSGLGLHNATFQLEKICAVANTNGDHAIYAFASIMQAFVALQASNSDSVLVAQRALANARTLQMSSDVAEQPQIHIMMEFVDLACSLQDGSPAPIEQKMKAMQQILYERLDDKTWHDDGTIYLPVSKKSLHGVALQEGGTIFERSGKLYLPFQWLSKATVEVLGFVMSAASVSYKNASDGGKAEKYLEEGIHLLRASVSSTPSAKSTKRQLQNLTLECCFLLDKAFMLCGKGDWNGAKSTTKELTELMQGFTSILPAEIMCAAKYLEGAIYQATGDLSTALRIFQSATFTLSPPVSETSSVRKTGQHQNDCTVRRFCLLAAMNSILIVRSPLHPQHHILEALLASIEALISSTSNKAIHASHSLVLSTLAGSSATILKTKQHLGNTLNVARASSNAQVTALALILMADKFFKGVVGEQAMKCAKAASHQARRSGDPLWLSVAQGMEAECLDIMGKTDDAKKLRDAAVKTTTELPEGILRAR